MQCPDRIAVIGGGRWARVLVDVLCGLVPPSVAISVHSRRNTGSMVAWAEARGLSNRVWVSSVWPPSLPVGSGAVIVANAARDHQMATEWAISLGVPTMVEKPIAVTVASAQRLVDLARDRKVRLAAAHVFLFATYFENFSKFVANAGPVESLHIDWSDLESEERYGERKQYDPSLPVFSDWLPHVVPISGTLLPSVPDNCRRVKFYRGGAALELELMAGSIPCTVRMERNAERRQRIVQASAGGEIFRLNFSMEPGTISRDSLITSGDRYWYSGKRPLARMLTAFLDWAAGGERDDRLDIGIGLRACKIIDQTSEMYRSALVPWLIGRLAAPGPIDEDLRYALSELLQAEGPLSAGELDRQISAVTSRFSGADGARLAGKLTNAHDAASLLRTLATSSPCSGPAARTG